MPVELILSQAYLILDIIMNSFNTKGFVDKK